VYQKAASGWQNAAATELTAPTVTQGDYFGGPATIIGSAILVDEGMATVGLNPAEGAIDVFTREGPSITLKSPAGGATYSQGQQVPAVFSCSAAVGTTLSSCSGTVAFGAPLPTSTLGTHTFTVTASGSDGGSEAQTVTYRVTPVAVGTLTVGRVTTTANSVNVVLSCRGTSGTSCWATATLTVAGFYKQHHARGAPRVAEVVGVRAVMLPAGKQATLNLALNAGGELLLHRRHTLTVMLTISTLRSGKRISVATRRITFNATSSKRRR
jgi:hypothetical protein